MGRGGGGLDRPKKDHISFERSLITQIKILMSPTNCKPSCWRKKEKKSWKIPPGKVCYVKSIRILFLELTVIQTLSISKFSNSCGTMRAITINKSASAKHEPLMNGYFVKKYPRLLLKHLIFLFLSFSPVLIQDVGIDKIHVLYQNHAEVGHQAWNGHKNV